MESLLEKWRSLSLRADETVTISAKEQSELMLEENIGLCVVGKVCTSKKINVEVSRTVMRDIWGMHINTRIELAGFNLFVLQFRSMAEKNRIIRSGPLTFDKRFIVIKSPRVDDQSIGMSFTHETFWLQIHNMPFQCMIKAMALKLGATVGEVVDLDGFEWDNWTGPFIRIRVKMDISKPLRRGFIIKLGGGLKVWCPVQYEKLPDFCFRCGVIGHLKRECVSLTGIGENETDPYRFWLHDGFMRKTTQNADGRRVADVPSGDIMLVGGGGVGSIRLAVGANMPNRHEVGRLSPENSAPVVVEAASKRVYHQFRVRSAIFPGFQF